MSTTDKAKEEAKAAAQRLIELRQESEFMELCHANPWLSMEKFAIDYHDGRREYYLVDRLVRKHASLGTIMQFCETFHPDEAALPKDNVFNPLYYACIRSGSVEGAVPYLAAKYPCLVRKRDPSPLRILLLSQNWSLMNYKALYNSYPEIITETDVSRALSGSSPQPVKDFIVERAPKCMSCLPCDGPLLPLSLLSCVKALTKFPPQQRQQLALYSESWDVESWMRFAPLLASWEKVELHGNVAEMLANDTGKNALKRALAVNTKLEDLCLTDNGACKADITDAFLSILQTSSIKAFRVHKCCLPLLDIPAALKSHKNLRGLGVPYCGLNHESLASIVEVLETDNTTLEKFAIDDDDDLSIHEDHLMRSIQYYTRLNCHGRGKAREPSTSKAELVELLHRKVRNKYWAAEPGYWYSEPTPLDKLNITFGLLLECPDKWSSSGICEGGSGKRRRSSKRQCPSKYRRMA